MEQSRLNLDFLNAIGRVWKSEDTDGNILEHGDLREAVSRIRDLLSRKPHRSVLLVGASGVGKTSVVRSLAAKLRDTGWCVFESRASNIIAGQIFVGMSEQRARDLVNNLAREQCVIWFIPNFQEMQHIGRTFWSPTSVLDMILPSIEEGKISVIGELRPAAYGQLMKENRKIQNVFSAVHMHPLNDRDTLELTKHWISRQEFGDGRTIWAEERTLEEAVALAKQYLTDRESPGSVLDLLSVACRNAADSVDRSHRLSLEDLLEALSDRTGLPKAILDERETLRIEELRGFFRHRVLGQAEAVDCLVERVAMIKAGLCDSNRPSGVFLFVGPTGTGKTEIAKALAEFLFGSPNRMVRLDMSEFQTPDSISKILGDRIGYFDEGSLVGKIRNQPFSVVLLDEFEKANPHIWNLFLQVFDDGRLTDAQGSISDFRHSIFILTSNLGATLDAGMSIGFTPESSAFSPQIVHKAILATFRPELLNRIDRIVVFRPLSRTVMRDILKNELAYTLQRRGLRTKDWAVEFENSALEFLLSRGFTPELGARPLKRAIERYLLSPLAMMMISREAPKGDQFLYVRSDGNRILVEFIDPNAQEMTDEQHFVKTAEDEERPSKVSNLRRLILQPLGNELEVKELHWAYEELSSRITGEDWRRKKDEALGQLETPDFWNSEGRFSVLGTVEYMERIESGLDTARSLIKRLGGLKGSTGALYSPKLIGRLSLQIYLLQEACASLEESIPEDAFLKVEIGERSKGDVKTLYGFADRLCRMYLQWAIGRHMRYNVLRDDGRNGYQSREFILAVSGFGAYAILAPENGLHVFEVPDKDKTYKRYTIRVRVVAQPEVPPLGVESLLQQAERIFRQETSFERKIVRSYREAPSPLARDNVRKWRTGRLDLVLDGNFDLFERVLRSG